MISILLIDDEPALLELGAIFLQRSGDIMVTTAGSAQEVAAMLEKAQFDAIVTDYIMPGVEGAALIRELRGHSESVPLIVLSGRSRDEIAADCISAGADAVLQKGGDPVVQYGDLRRLISGHLQSGSPAEF